MMRCAILAAFLAVVFLPPAAEGQPGWLLLLAPERPRGPEKALMFDTSRPLSEWEPHKAFDTAGECQAQKAFYENLATKELRPHLLDFFRKKLDSVKERPGLSREDLDMERKRLDVLKDRAVRDLGGPPLDTSTWLQLLRFSESRCVPASAYHPR